MSFEVNDLINGLREARQSLLKHLDGMTEEQWSWKPYPECKSVRETLTHLIMGDRLLRYRLADDPRAGDFENVYTEVEADYANFTREELIAELESSHEDVCRQLLDRYGDKPLDEPFRAFGGEQKIGKMLAGLANERYYHIGQIAFIRMATDPSWDYYQHIFNYKSQ